MSLFDPTQDYIFSVVPTVDTNWAVMYSLNLFKYLFSLDIFVKLESLLVSSPQGYVFLCFICKPMTRKTHLKDIEKLTFTQFEKSWFLNFSR